MRGCRLAPPGQSCRAGTPFWVLAPGAVLVDSSPPIILQEWRRFVSDRSAGAGVAPLILESWGRSRAAGVDPEQAAFARVPDDELDRRLQRAAPLVEVARSHLQAVARALAHIPHVVYITDADGIVLASHGSSPQLMDEAGLHPGFDWSERRMGTNGAGTCIASNQSVAVIGCEHYCRAWHQATCVAAPIRDGDGAVIGALDVSTHLEDGSPERLILVEYVARSIGEELLSRGRGGGAPAGVAAVPVDQVLALTGHELKTPVQALVLQLALLEGALERGEDARVRRGLERLRRQVGRLASLVERVHDISVIATGRLFLERDLVDVAALARDVVDQLQESARHHRASVVVRAGAPAVGAFDGVRVDQVLTNLLTNALKYGAGSPVDVLVEDLDDAVRVSVVDRGPGIAPADRERIFQRFQRASPSAIPGLGVGLWVAREIARAHGGELSVESAPGRGATFRLVLPKTPPARRGPA